MYEQIINPASWSTMSEMTLGLAYRMTQNTLPNLLFNVLWASEYPFSLIPEDAGDMEGQDVNDLARRTREWLIFNLRTRMRVDSTGYGTILDGVKLGVGYGIVEPVTVFTHERAKTTVSANGKSASRFSLGVAKPTQHLRYRYLNFGSVLPMPDGATPDESTATSVVDVVDEFSLASMFADKESPIEGDIKEVVEYAKKNGYDASTMTIRSIIAKLSGHSPDSAMRFNPMRAKCKGVAMIPIVKHFRKDRHIWIACDRFVLYKSERTAQTLQCPVVKYTFSPEGGNWFTRGVISPNRDLMRSTETWYNAMLDLFSLHLHPHQIVNLDMLPEADSAEDLQPYAKTFVRGAPSNAQAFVAPPTLPASVSSIGDRLQAISDENAGIASNQGASVSGMTRGGSMALESIMQSSTNREKMLAKHLENTWYEPLIRLTLIYSSIFSSDEVKFTVLSPDRDAKQKKGKANKLFDSIRITSDDLAHVWRVTINFREKVKNFLIESAHRLQVYDRLIKDPEVNKEELKHYLIGDEAQVGRLLRGVDKEQNLDDMRSLALAQNPQMEAAMKAGGMAPGTVPMNAGAPGGALGGGGSGSSAMPPLSLPEGEV